MSRWFALSQHSELEGEYLKKVNRGFLWLLIAHLPIVLALPFFFESSLVEGLVLFALALSVPIWACRTSPTSRATSCLLAFSGICISGILIHLSKGMIEFHFHIFVALAWMIVFGNPWALIVAAGTAAVHHLAFYFILPSSVFNYQASLSIVLLHAAFVVAETVVNLIVSLRIHRMISSQSTFKANADQVRHSVDKLAAQFSESTQRLEEQSVNLQSAASSVTEINQMVSSTADNALQASSAGAQMMAKVTEGKRVIADLRSDFDMLASATDSGEASIRKSFEDIKELLNFFNEIESKTKIINEIVFQTKLLSFNASVEAARAGEHGKGFAVVAEEVGNLARLSGNAASEINTLLSSGNERSRGILENALQRAETTFQEIIEKVAISGKQTENCLKTFDQIASDLNIATDRLSQIADANKEQKLGVESLTKTFTEVAQAAQDITHSARSSSAEGRLNTDASLDQLTRNLAHMLGGEQSSVDAKSGSSEIRENSVLIRESEKKHKLAS